eukprot:TRINITY_DN10238_c0_g1_i2.p1 TRINITY_DN10238_c0_g1~~TRINITY_DN10238_c0_g1_i2.p1  ORF type:complete len:276 (+),score=99.92 TRINITY_DN10238_c0_g1_i2:97-924(+)
MTTTTVGGSREYRQYLLEYVRDCTNWRIERTGDDLREPEWAVQLKQQLEDLVERSCESPTGKDSPSQRTFENVDEPATTVADYLWILWLAAEEKGLRSEVLFCHAYIYLTRFLETGVVRATPCAVHRLILVAFVAAVKVCEDAKGFSNVFLARLGDVSLRNLNRMEMIFLSALDFNLFVGTAEYHKVLYSALHDPRESSEDMQHEAAWRITNTSFVSVSSVDLSTSLSSASASTSCQAASADGAWSQRPSTLRAQRKKSLFERMKSSFQRSKQPH